MLGFLNFSWLDFLDILLVAFLFYKLYQLVKGTQAINILIGLFASYLLWLIVKSFDMQLLSLILGQVMGVGVIAILIVFQEEIRRFFLYVGRNYFHNLNFSFESIFQGILQTQSVPNIDEIIEACKKMSQTKTGALIAIAGKNEEFQILDNKGTVINAQTTSELIQTIFFKNSPLHDGGLCISGPTILWASSIFPVSKQPDLPTAFGLRHRSALGLAEQSNAIVIVVSEETGMVSYAEQGKLVENIDFDSLKKLLYFKFVVPKTNQTHKKILNLQ